MSDKILLVSAAVVIIGLTLKLKLRFVWPLISFLALVACLLGAAMLLGLELDLTLTWVKAWVK